ncbi:hypothetical protein [Brevundimonas lenta]|uniref:Lipoprotein n=1 Tax=Brevundimonas lenta TaxID=424796 RepID=A0A7W6JAT0_9CAUL|nr:hypothetical protein [Brevundimonas lenta]MBB4081699.1 hypothetical protein [Brevundimonas lenta]
MKKSIAAALCASLALAACASSPESIEATYISPATYGSLDCAQLEQELIRVGNRVNVVTGRQRSQAQNDAMVMGVGLVLFWPALFFLKGNGGATELGQLKGEYDALHANATEKRCGFEARTAS